MARFAFSNNKHASDYGKDAQEENARPESIKLVERQLADAKVKYGCELVLHRLYVECDWFSKSIVFVHHIYQL